jgi:hypothetical protein
MHAWPPSAYRSEPVVAQAEEPTWEVRPLAEVTAAHAQMVECGEAQTSSLIA